MPITISFQRTAIDRVEAQIDAQLAASFEPAALMVDQPLFSQRPAPADPRAYGQRLFAALGGDTFRAALARLPRAPHMDSLIAIQTADAELASIPWEYLHDGADFLILNYLLVREVPDAPLPAPPAPDLPWRLVVMGSDPLVQEVRDPKTGLFTGYAPMQRLKVVQELDLLRDDLLRQNPPAPIRWQRIAPTRQALIDDLDPREPILFHYTGHGDVENGAPVLCFDDGTGCMDPRPVNDLAADLRGLVYLAFLNACRTADSREPGANLALALVQHGIPAVLGTQYQVLDEAAAHVARTFYRLLASGQHPAQALYRARLQLKNQFRSEPREWAIPVLYLAQNYAWQVQRPVLNEPLRPLEPPVPHTTQLRAPDQSAGRFVGRNKELLDLARLFINEQRRIVTIRGAGGMGKTALVNALAERLRFHFRDGIVAVSLFLPGENAPLRAAQVRRDLATLLGLQHPAFDLPDAVKEQELALVEAARARPRLLLIWDNYETVLWRLGREASDPSSAPFDEAQRTEAAAVQRLVRLLADKGVHLIFTSRQSPVGLAGETFYPPAERGHQLGGLDPNDSVRLLRMRVGQRLPSTTFLEQLAAAVGYNPLAMNLAAARWANSQDDEPTFIANLRDELSKARDPAAPMYQQSSVEINVRLSLNALPADLRADLLALTIIANPVIIPRHGAVIWGLEDETQWFDDQAHTRLEQLHQASLLQGQGYDEQRNRAHAYSLHPLIASVLSRLAQELDLSDARARYAAWSDHLVSRAYDPEHGIDADPAVAAQTQFLLADIAAAVPYLPPEQRGWAAWRAASVFERLGQPEQAYQSITLAEATARETENQELLSRVYHQRATLLETRGDLDGAMRLYEQSLAIQESLGDVRGTSATLHAMAGVLVTRGDLDGAMRLYEQSLAIKESLGDVRGKSATLHQMAGVLVTRGDLDGAMRLYEQSLAIQESLGDVRGKSATLHQMAGVLVTRGDLDGAMRLYEQSLAIKESLGDVRGKSATLHAMAGVLVTRGDLDGAMRLYEQSLAIQESLGDVRGKSATLHAMAGVLVTRGDLDGAMRLYEQSLASDESLGDVRGTSATLHNMAHVLETRGDLDGAMRLYEQSLAIQESLGDVRGKSATLHAMAGVLETRGDLDGAMRLYEQSLAIKESLGDVRGTSATLHQMAGVLVTRGDLDGAMRLYEQSLAIQESLGDVRGKSATLHQMAGVLVTRGDLDGAMRLYEQSLAIQESLGDVRGKSATLVMMAQIQFARGDHETALRNARESLRLLQAMGAAPDAAKVAEIVQQMEAALAGGASPQPAAFTPARLVGALIGAVVRVQRGQMPAADLRADLERLSAEATLTPITTALLAALDGAADAAATLLVAAEPLLAQGAAAERADALAGIGNLAALLDDHATELRAREAAVAAFRAAGDDRQSLVNLSIALYNLAMLYARQGNHAAAVPLLEEVVALDERTGHPDLASDRAKLEEMRRHAAGLPEVSLVDVIAEWRDGDRDHEQFVNLLNLVCNLYVQTMSDGSSDQRERLAEDLAHLRAIRPLPVAGANDFLAVLQLRLRDEPGMTERAARIAATLPAQLAQALAMMDQAISGEPVAPPADSDEQEAAAAMAAMLSGLPPEQRAELQILAQVVPLVLHGIGLLRQPDLTAAERGRFAEVLEQAASQAETGETAGSPWLAAAGVLRQVAGWLKGAPAAPDTLPEPYRSLVMRMLEGAGDE
ncbi:tetratricopeptide repeat protein [Roseiflexus sp. RS-1]|uniref:tetratricopeptide repeat protein n=1 Tax=Roseiflexus sp. (strain RS-1) TaxID=357808 RepID=UPI0000D8208E|nr:tetratricopeptide repeat protein [Roseiflexus sp. RS-1]ABQ90959.1 Tetratricopeptide TPR_2 repeat protein [Roseiflexus sp. RS-1]